jgi:hypothetical protein
MKKIYTSGILLIIISIFCFSQPADKTIIVVGGSTPPAPEDGVLIDSLDNWIENVIYMSAAEFNFTIADSLYKDVDGVVISESITSSTIPNFARRDDYPVPCIVMEGVFSGPDDINKWPLLSEDGGIWGYPTPEEDDIQWRIADEEHYITSGFQIDDVIYYAETAARGVPYIHHIVPDHIILATAVRTDGGDQEGYNQDEAIACAWIEFPALIYMNVAYTYYAEGTPEWYGILKRSAQFLFDFVPVSTEQRLSPSTNLSVYPNPSSGNSRISYSMETVDKVRINLISITGGLVGNIYNGISQKGENIIDLETEKFPAGLYFIELNVNDKLAYTKLVIK